MADSVKVVSEDWVAICQQITGKMEAIDNDMTEFSKILDELSKMNADIMGTTSDPFYGAPVVIWVLADRNVHTYVEDGSLAIGNMLLEAHALGLGACWIHRAKEMSELPEGRALLQKWGVSDDEIGVGCCILGYTKGEQPEKKPRRNDQIIVVE